jgi:hypothetical protein
MWVWVFSPFKLLDVGENWRVEKDLAQCELSLSDPNDISKARRELSIGV